MVTARRPALSLVYRLRASAPAEPEVGGQPPLLILLHGVGSNELSMAALAGSFDPRLIVLSVRSPIELAPFSFAWFNVTFTADGPVIDGNEAQEAWTRLTRFVGEAVDAFDADPGRVFVGGFSQGGIVALATILTTPEAVAGAFCMSGRLPPEVLPHLAPDDRLRGKPVLIVHGRQDETLPVALARNAVAILRPRPLRLRYEEFDIGHAVSDASVAVVASWLAARLDEPRDRA